MRFFFSTTTCLHFHFNKIKAKYLIQQLLDMQKLHDTKSRKSKEKCNEMNNLTRNGSKTSVNELNYISVN